MNSFIILLLSKYTLLVDQIKMYKRGGACAVHGVKRKAYSVFVGKAERKRTLGIPRHRWAGNITVGLKYNGRARPGMIS